MSDLNEESVLWKVVAKVRTIHADHAPAFFEQRDATVARPIPPAAPVIKTVFLILAIISLFIPSA